MAVRRVRAIEIELEAEVERALALGEVGLRRAIAPQAVRPPMIVRRAEDVQRTEHGWAPFQPVPQPAPGEPLGTGPRTPTTGTASWGASGTPITAGYLIDLGEYNPSVYGREAVFTFEKMRRGDSHVWGTLRASKQPIFSAEWDLKPGVKPNDPGYAAAKQVADFCRDNLFGGLEFETSAGGVASQPFHSVIYNALLMLDFGCAVHEDVYAVDGDRIRLRALPSRQALTFYRWHTEADGETLVGLEQYGYRGRDFVNATLPADKMCRFTYNQEGANFWGLPMTRPMYPHWYIVNSLYRVAAISAERNGLGIPVITLNPGFSNQDRQAAFSFVTKLSAHELAGLVLPPESKAMLMGVTGAVADVMKQIEHHKREMSKVALQQFLTLGTAPHGSRATAAVQHGFFMSASEHLADQLCESFTRQTLRRLARYNFGPEAPVPKLVAKNLKSVDISDSYQQLVQLAQSGLVVSERNIRDWIRGEYDLPEESDEGIVAPKGETVTPVGGRDTGEVGGFQPAAPRLAGRGVSAFELGDNPLAAEQVLYVARHGQTDDDLPGRDTVSGWRDIRLNATGRRQAQEMAERCMGAGIAEIRSSDLPRTMQTARIVADIIGAQVIADPRLRSWNLPGLAGLPINEAKPAIDRGLASPFRPPVKGADSYASYLGRFAEGVRDAVRQARKSGRPVMVVTHSWGVNAVPDVLSGRRIGKAKPMPPGGMNRLNYKGGNWQVKALMTEVPLSLAARPTRPAPRHLDLAEARRSVASGSAGLMAELTGRHQTRLIRALAAQAVAQLKRGTRPAELHFHVPPDFAHRLIPHLDRLYSQARRQARAEVNRQFKERR